MKYLNYKLKLIVLTILFLISCNKNKIDNFHALEGYWEIESVTLVDGTKKDYTFSNTIDYISINDNLTGFRKKLKPSFNGTFETSKDAEIFSIVIENDSLNLYYETPFDNWKESILKINDQQFVSINKNKIIYTYKRYEPISLD